MAERRMTLNPVGGPAGASMLPLAIEGFVGKDYEELVFVLMTMAFSFAVMVAFGAWWSR